MKAESHPLQALLRSARVLSSGVTPTPASTSALCATGKRTVQMALMKVESAHHQHTAKQCSHTCYQSPRGPVSSSVIF